LRARSVLVRSLMGGVLMGGVGVGNCLWGGMGEG
jgi:hypothetical protein